jgi:hypothetical protein
MARAARAVERETEEHSVERDTNPGTRRFSRRRAAALRHVIAGTVLSIVSQRYATGDHTRKRTDVKTTGRGESMARADKSYMRVACRGRAIGRLGIVQRYIMGVFEGAMERGTVEWRSAEGRSLRNARGGRRGTPEGGGPAKSTDTNIQTRRVASGGHGTPSGCGGPPRPTLEAAPIGAAGRNRKRRTEYPAACSPRAAKTKRQSTASRQPQYHTTRCPSRRYLASGGGVVKHSSLMCSRGWHRRSAVGAPAARTRAEGRLRCRRRPQASPGGEVEKRATKRALPWRTGAERSVGECARGGAALPRRLG